jgi:hypothetical protein
MYTFRTIRYTQILDEACIEIIRNTKNPLKQIVDTKEILNLCNTVGTTGQTPITTRKCEEMQAITEETTKHISVSPNDLPNEEYPKFQPTSAQGATFPDNNKTPIITVNFYKPAEVQSITLPRDKTQNANVQRFEVTFYTPDGNKINNVPISSNTSPKEDNTTPAHLDSSQIPSNTPVSHFDIKIIQTTDDRSPKGVILDVKACTEPITG